MSNNNFGAENEPPKTSRLRNNYGAACVRFQRARAQRHTIALLSDLEYDDSDLALYITCDTTTTTKERVSSKPLYAPTHI